MTGFAATTSRAPAGLALAFIATATLAGFLPLLAFGIVGGMSSGGSYLLQVTAFTLLQAGLKPLLLRETQI